MSRKTVTKWKAEGKIAMDGDGVDVSASQALLKKFAGARSKVHVTHAEEGNVAPVTHAGRDGAITSDRDDDLHDAAAAVVAALGLFPSKAEAELAKESWIAHMRRLQYEREAGKVIEVQHVAKIVGESLARVRTRLLAIPAEQSPRLNRIKTVTELQDALLECITEALQELVDPAAFAPAP